jgi:hypothetical protein
VVFLKTLFYIVCLCYFATGLYLAILAQGRNLLKHLCLLKIRSLIECLFAFVIITVLGPLIIALIIGFATYILKQNPRLRHAMDNFFQGKSFMVITNERRK